MLEKQGYVKLWRKTLDSGLMGHPNALALFIHILINAQWHSSSFTTRYGAVKLGRGECVVGRFKTAQEIGVTPQEFRTALDLLVTMEIVTKKSTNEYTVVKLVKYDFYQAQDSEDNQRRTSGEPAANQRRTTVKEVKNLELNKDLPGEAQEQDHKPKGSKYPAISLPPEIDEIYWQSAVGQYYPIFDPRHPQQRIQTPAKLKELRAAWETKHGKPYEPVPDLTVEIYQQRFANA